VLGERFTVVKGAVFDEGLSCEESGGLRGKTGCDRKKSCAHAESFFIGYSLFDIGCS
jgi:hypothetical protein